MKVALLVAPLAFLALAPPALAAPVSMEDLVQKAMTQSPTIRAAQSTVRVQEERVTTARSDYWPQVSLSAGSSETTSVSPTQTSAAPINVTSTGLAARQTLWTFGKLDAQVDQAEAQMAVSRAQAEVTAVEVAYGVRQAYLNWVQAAGLETQASEQIRFAETTLAEARARLRAGVAAQLDVTRAETSVAQARAQLATARATTAQARRSLAAAIGQNTPVAGEPAFPSTPAVANRPLTELEAASNAHPDLRAAQSQLAVAEASTRAAAVAGLPDLGADLSYGLRARDFQPAQNWQAGLNFSWPLFTGYRITSQARAAEAQEMTVRQNYEARRLTVLRDIDNAYLSLEGAKETVPAAKAALDAARANLKQAQGRYRAGVGSIIEVTDAQSLLASAQADWVRATTSYHLSIASLQRAMGLTGVANDR
jgi:outer membrane protein